MNSSTARTATLGRGQAVHYVVATGKSPYGGYVAATSACGKTDNSRNVADATGQPATCKSCLKAMEPTAPVGKAKKLEATLPDGHIVTRTTARDYLYVVAVRGEGKAWGAWAWSSRYELAAARAREIRGKHTAAVAAEVKVVEVNNPRNEDDAAAAQAMATAREAAQAVAAQAVAAEAEAAVEAAPAVAHRADPVSHREATVTLPDGQQISRVQIYAGELACAVAELEELPEGERVWRVLAWFPTPALARAYMTRTIEHRVDRRHRLLDLRVIHVDGYAAPAAPAPRTDDAVATGAALPSAVHFTRERGQYIVQVDVDLALAAYRVDGGGWEAELYRTEPAGEKSEHSYTLMTFYGYLVLNEIRAVAAIFVADYRAEGDTNTVDQWQAAQAVYDRQGDAERMLAAQATTAATMLASAATTAAGGERRKAYAGDGRGLRSHDVVRLDTGELATIVGFPGHGGVQYVSVYLRGKGLGSMAHQVPATRVAAIVTPVELRQTY